MHVTDHKVEIHLLPRYSFFFQSLRSQSNGICHQCNPLTTCSEAALKQIAHLVTLRMSVLLLVTFLLAILLATRGFQPGDRVAVLSQTLHNGWKTQLNEFPIHHMPHFRQADSFIIHAALPSPDGKPLMSIKPDEDIKIMLTFDDSKLISSWLTIFDAKNRKSLKKLILTFDHDEFDILHISYTMQYSDKIQKLDPSHPSLHSYEIVYKWHPILDDDVVFGVKFMFIIGLIVLFVLFVTVIPIHNRNVSKKSNSFDRVDRSGKERANTTTRSGAGFYYKK